MVPLSDERLLILSGSGDEEVLTLHNLSTLNKNSSLLVDKRRITTVGLFRISEDAYIRFFSEFLEVYTMIPGGKTKKHTLSGLIVKVFQLSSFRYLCFGSLNSIFVDISSESQGKEVVYGAEITKVSIRTGTGNSGILNAGGYGRILVCGPDFEGIINTLEERTEVSDTYSVVGTEPSGRVKLAPKQEVLHVHRIKEFEIQVGRKEFMIPKEMEKSRCLISFDSELNLVAAQLGTDPSRVLIFDPRNVVPNPEYNPKKPREVPWGILSRDHVKTIELESHLFDLKITSEATREYKIVFRTVVGSIPLTKVLQDVIGKFLE